MESGSFIDWSKSIGVEKLPSFKRNIIFFMKHLRMIRTVIRTLERIWFLVITTIAWDTRAFSAASSNVARIVCFSIIEKYCIVHSFLFVIISWTIFTISVYMSIEHLFINTNTFIFFYTCCNIYYFRSPHKNSKVRLSDMIFPCCRVHYFFYLFFKFLPMTSYKSENDKEHPSHLYNCSFIMLDYSNLFQNITIKRFVYLKLRELFNFIFESLKSTLILLLTKQTYVALMFTFSIQFRIKKAHIRAQQSLQILCDVSIIINQAF